MPDVLVLNRKLPQWPTHRGTLTAQWRAEVQNRSRSYCDCIYPFSCSSHSLCSSLLESWFLMWFRVIRIACSAPLGGYSPRGVGERIYSPGRRGAATGFTNPQRSCLARQVSLRTAATPEECRGSLGWSGSLLCADNRRLGHWTPRHSTCTNCHRGSWRLPHDSMPWYGIPPHDRLWSQYFEQSVSIKTYPWSNRPPLLRRRSSNDPTRVGQNHGAPWSSPPPFPTAVRALLSCL